MIINSHPIDWDQLIAELDQDRAVRQKCDLSEYNHMTSLPPHIPPFPPSPFLPNISFCQCAITEDTPTFQPHCHINLVTCVQNISTRIRWYCGIGKLLVYIGRRCPKPTHMNVQDVRTSCNKLHSLQWMNAVYVWSRTSLKSLRIWYSLCINQTLAWYT